MGYSNLLYYKGYTVIVENYIYKLALVPNKWFLSFRDIIKEIDRIEEEKCQTNS